MIPLRFLEWFGVEYGAVVGHPSHAIFGAEGAKSPELILVAVCLFAGEI